MNNSIQVGNTFQVEMMKNEKDLLHPVCKVEGRICFMHKKSNKYPAPGETWLVEVAVIKDRYLVIFPVKLIMDAQETETMNWYNLQALKKKYNKK